MRTISFFVQGDPKPQPRPRAFAFHGHARVYDAGTAEGWKSLIAVAARNAGINGVDPFLGPVQVKMKFIMRRPNHHSTKRGLKQDAPYFHCQKPDADNFFKAATDALTQIGAWKDDCQVAVAGIEKIWTCLNSPVPGCDITIDELAHH